MSLTRIGSIGINTGIAFAGVTTIVTLNTANDALSIGATVNVGSGITLGASGDIFATGVSTFSGNVKVGTGITLSPDGHVFHTGVVTATTFSGALAASNLTGALPAISGANLTNLDASDLASGTVPTARLGSGTASSSTFLRGDSSFQTVNTDLVSDTSPQLGGDLDTNSHHILLDDSHAVKFGNSTELEITHTGSSGYAHFGNTTGNLIIDTSGNFYVRNATGAETYIQATANGAVDLYHDNVKTFHTKQNGVVVEGTEGAGAILEMRADEGDDNNDYFRLYDDSSFLSFQGYGAGSWTTLLSLQQQNQVRLYYNGSEKLNTSNQGVSISGKIYMNNGNLQFGASGNGVDFSATSDASGKTSELLDDYEEGTWSPVWSNATSGGTTSVSAQMHGRYTKIGRMVTLHFYTWGLPTGPTGSIYLQGLPFTAGGIGEVFGAVQAGYYNDGNTSTYNLGVSITTGNNYGNLQFNNAGNNDVTPASFSGFINSYTNFTGTVTYLVS